METGNQFAELVAAMSAVSDEEAKQLPPAEKAKQADLLGELAIKYPQQLQAAVELGFAPAQFTAAKMLAFKALQERAQRDVYKAQACELVGKAAASGLFIAALGQSQYCAGPSDVRDFSAVLKATEDAYQQLAVAITRADPYAAYYPLKALRMPECFERELDPFDENLTLLERVQASQPPLLTLDETRAEGFYRLADREVGHDKALAREHVQQAAALGCSSKAFTTLQTFANKPSTVTP